MSLIMCGQRNHPAVKRGIRFMHAYPEQKFNGGSISVRQLLAVQCMYQSREEDFNSYYPYVSISTC